MNNISLLVQEWYQTRNQTTLKQIFEEIQESNIHFFGACFKTWTNKGAIDDANECIQRFNVSLYEKLTKENDPTPIVTFEHYCRTVRRRVFLNFRRTQQKKQETNIDPTDPASGKNILERLADNDNDDLEKEVWHIYKKFMDGNTGDLSYGIFKLRIEQSISHEAIAIYLNKKFKLQGDKALTSSKVRKRYSKLLSKWRRYCKEKFKP
ncbi:hypothetical protein [Microscilla marina]|uniref:Uncharacterized protein n=1 Tax=Microscilla marina ATCC 23134 TaxID=313606 RepID=A1ZFL5_MICM2|nr:hypothetical protein [Microscilla marina]EAY30789.1 hypothetical protein M23134_01113 [Microscilla marina ATCC 23134]